jgi:AraC-like DNA-binding protein
MHAQGRSDRQIDRRIKDWTGLPLRQLRGMGRAEGTLLQARDALSADELKWADIAATMDFSDQAHLSREFRRITGLSPRTLKERLRQESYWMYQIWT